MQKLKQTWPLSFEILPPPPKKKKKNFFNFLLKLIVQKVWLE